MVRKREVDVTTVRSFKLTKKSVFCKKKKKFCILIAVVLHIFGCVIKGLRAIHTHWTNAKFLALIFHYNYVRSNHGRKQGKGHNRPVFFATSCDSIFISKLEVI